MAVTRWIRTFGGSMRPLLKTGDEALIRDLEPNEPRPGQIVLLAGEPQILHRVVKVDSETITTKGDARSENDPERRRDEILGIAQVRLRNGRTADLESNGGAAAFSLPYRIIGYLGALGKKRTNKNPWVDYCLPHGPKELALNFAADSIPTSWAEEAIKERLGPLLYMQLADRNLSAPPILTKEFFLSAGADAFQTNWINEIGAEFAAEGIGSALLKGAWLAKNVYPDGAMRPRADADLLISHHDLRAADATLRELGLAPQGSGEAVKNVLKTPEAPTPLPSLDYRDEENRMSCHLHWALVNSSIPLRHGIGAPNGDKLLKQAREIDFGPTKLLELNPEVHLLHLLEHLTRPGHVLTPLIRIVDIPWVIDKFGADLTAKSLELADEWGWRKLAEKSMNQILNSIQKRSCGSRGFKTMGIHLDSCKGWKDRTRLMIEAFFPSADIRDRRSSSKSSVRGNLNLRGKELLKLFVR